MRIAIAYNRPTLPETHADYASEAGVLEAVAGIERALREGGHDVWRVPVDARPGPVVQALEARRPDVLVNLCEGFAGTARGEAHLAALWELLAVPYTGATPECLALVRDKPRAKAVLQAAGLRTAGYLCVARGEPLPTEMPAELGEGPWFVKPAGEDASLGIDSGSIVGDRASLERQIASIQQRYGDALVERYLPGREFNVGVVALPDVQVLPLAEIEFRTSAEFPWPIVTYDSKWTESSIDFEATPARCPADVEPALADRMRRLAEQAFRVTGCRDYARVDFRVTPEGEVFVLEVNANPDASPSAGLARALGVAGIDYANFARRLVDAAAARHGVPTGVTSPRPSRGAGPIIRAYRPEDKPALLAVLEACQMFRPDEIEVADEVLTEALGPEGHYQVLVAEVDGAAVGWSCHGLTPMTDATYDLYWIAVHPGRQSSGVGRCLVEEVERRLQAAGGRLLIAETSTSEMYQPTRGFYLRTGFELASDLADFYRLGDGKATYVKRLDS